jgi:predicted ribosome quality control (RQC) complex YloA/Tae2 family protein
MLPIQSRLTVGLLSGLLSALPLGVVLGQNAPPSQADPPINNRPLLVAPAQPSDRAGGPKRPARPVVPGQPVQTQQMKDLVREFQAARQDFINQQQELRRQLKTANDAQRAIIREQLKEKREQWMEQQKAQIQELKEQAREMNRVGNLRDVIDSGSGEGGPGSRPGR